MDFDKLVGREDIRLVGFDPAVVDVELPEDTWGAQQGVVVLRVGRKNYAYLLLEDFSDDLRSEMFPPHYLEEVPSGAILQFRARSRSVRVERLEGQQNIHGYQVVDIATDHVWLCLGTDWSDTYYPLGICRWEGLCQV